MVAGLSILSIVVAVGVTGLKAVIYGRMANAQNNNAKETTEAYTTKLA